MKPSSPRLVAGQHHEVALYSPALSCLGRLSGQLRVAGLHHEVAEAACPSCLAVVAVRVMAVVHKGLENTLGHYVYCCFTEER